MIELCFRTCLENNGSERRRREKKVSALVSLEVLVVCDCPLCYWMTMKMQQ